MGGIGTTFATAGGIGLIACAWQAGAVHGSRLLFDMLSIDNDGPSILIIILIILGAVAFGYLAIQSVVDFARAATNEVMRAATGASEQAKRRLVKEHVVLNF